MIQAKTIKFEFRRRLLREEFSRRALKNNRYSLRSFANCLGMEPSTLSQLIRGKRNFNDHYLNNICKSLNWNETQILEDEKKYLKEKTTLPLIPKEHLYIRSNWYCFAILELTHLKNFKPSIKWIAKNLQIHTQLVEEAVQNLVNVGALIITEDDQWIDNYGNVTFIENEDMDIQPGRQHQQGLIERAQKSIDKNIGGTKSHTNVTFAISKKDIATYKKFIKEFRRNLILNAELSENEKDVVYCTQINFFPLAELNCYTTREKQIDAAENNAETSLDKIEENEIASLEKAEIRAKNSLKANKHTNLINFENNSNEENL